MEIERHSSVSVKGESATVVIAHRGDGTTLVEFDESGEREIVPTADCVPTNAPTTFRLS